MLGFNPLASNPIAASSGESIDAIITGAVAATGATDGVTVSLGTGISVSVSGITATGATKDVTVNTTELTGGWNRSFWGSGRWSTPITFVRPEGVSAAGVVSSVTTVTTINATVNVSSVTGVGVTNDVTVLTDGSIIIGGLAAVGSVGEISSITGNASFIPTGVAATGAVSAVGTSITGVGVDVSPDGVTGVGVTNNVTTVIGKIVSVDGVTATGATDDVTVTAEALVSLQGVVATGVTSGIKRDTVVDVRSTPFAGWGRGAWGNGGFSSNFGDNLLIQTSVGTATVTLIKRVDVLGIAGTGKVNEVTINAGTARDVVVSGVAATGLTSSRTSLVWGRIIPSEAAVWTGVAPNTTTIYTEIRP